MQLVKLGSACPGLMLGQQRPDQKLLEKKNLFLKNLKEMMNKTFCSHQTNCLAASKQLLKPEM